MTHFHFNPFGVSIEHKIMVVEIYINVFKEKNVRISPHYLDLKKLDEAYKVANKWFENNITEFIQIG